MVAILLVGVAVSFLAKGISASCKSEEFPCNDGSCVLKFQWCDGEEHCKDGSDEKYCLRSSLTHNPNKCKDDFFLCKDGSCIPIGGRCDGHPSCHDRSDEDNCGTTTELSTDWPSKTILHATTSTRQPQTEVHHLVTSTQHPKIFHHEREVKMNVHDSLQSDSAINETKPKKSVYIDITKGFVEVDPQYFIHEKSKAEAWLLATRDHEYSWGDETARAITALYLTSEDLEKKSSNETMLMIKQLHLKISIALIRNQTKELPLSELASFINALHATCHNPKNFYGHDLIEILRHRTNHAQVTDEFVSPLVYLTLCMCNSTTLVDLGKLQNYAASPKLDKMDMQALVSLAATCISSTTKFASFHLGPQIARRLYDTVTLLGLPENIYELSLVVQALNEGRINQDRWNRSDALHHIISMQQENGSFGDILSTYYALPVLSSKSLFSLAKHCYPECHKDMVPLDVLMNGDEEKTYVSYSLYFGKPVEVSQTLRIKVCKSTNLLDVMRIAESTNPMYRFRFDIARGKPFVFSIGGIVNDAEQGLYWTLHHSMRNSTGPENLQPYDGDIRSFIPTANDHVVFWMKELY